MTAPERRCSITDAYRDATGRHEVPCMSTVTHRFRTPDSDGWTLRCRTHAAWLNPDRCEIQPLEVQS